MPARTISIIVLGGSLAAALTACTASGTTTSQPSAGVPTTAPTTPPTTTPPSRPGKTSAPAAGCPVSTDTLQKVLDDKYGGDSDYALLKVKCYENYAIADRIAVHYDSEVVTFHYASGSWHYFTGGSGGYCEGVPANVKKHFRSVGYGGCD